MSLVETMSSSFSQKHDDERRSAFLVLHHGHVNILGMCFQYDVLYLTCLVICILFWEIKLFAFTV